MNINILMRLLRKTWKSYGLKMNKMEDVLTKVAAIRAARKASLKGIELMHWNLFWKLRGWIMRQTSERCVTVGELVDKVRSYAPKTILRSRDEFVKALESLSSAVHDYRIQDEDFLCEDLEFELSNIYK